MTVTLPIRMPVDTGGAMVATEVIQAQRGVVARILLPVGEPATLRLPQGRFLLRIRPPGGPVSDHEMTVDTAEESLTVLLSADTDRLQQERQAALGEAFDGAWVRLWALEDAWREVPLPGKPELAEGVLRRLRLQLPLGRIHAIQLGGKRIPWRVAMLPPAPEVDVVITTTGTLGFDGGARLEARSGDGAVEALLGYMKSGQLDSARVVAPVVLEALHRATLLGADGLLPAVAVGYFLLRTSDQAGPFDWMERLSEQAGWLPDAAIILASSLLRRQPDPDLGRARSLLVQAAQVGLPVYRDGLGLAFEGLRALASGTSDDPRTDGALAAVEPFARAADWRQHLASFRGHSPAEPTFSAILGVPTSAVVTIPGKRHVRVQRAGAQQANLAAAETIVVTRRSDYIDFSVTSQGPSEEAERVAEVRVLMGGLRPRLYQRSGPSLSYGDGREPVPREVRRAMRLDARVNDDLVEHLETNLRLE
jgi:hypothetical protein